MTQKDTFKVIGHRGAAGLLPENSLPSIQKALDIGVDRVEIDVHQSKDGRVVVIHDKTLNRTTKGNGLVKKLDLAEIQKIPLKGIASTTDRVPTLEEVLECINGQSVLLIEIKHGKKYYPNIEQNILDIIEQFKAKDWCILQSFDNRVLRETYRLDTEIALHKLFDTPYFFNFKAYPYIKEYGISNAFAGKRILQKVHRMQKKLNVWTVNEEKRMEELIQLGVDGIITDFPNKAKALQIGY